MTPNNKKIPRIAKNNHFVGMAFSFPHYPRARKSEMVGCYYQSSRLRFGWEIFARDLKQPFCFCAFEALFCLQLFYVLRYWLLACCGFSCCQALMHKLPKRPVIQKAMERGGVVQ